MLQQLCTQIFAQVAELYAGGVVSRGENRSRHIVVYVGKAQVFDEPIPRCVWRAGCTWSSCLTT